MSDMECEYCGSMKGFYCPIIRKVVCPECLIEIYETLARKFEEVEKNGS